MHVEFKLADKLDAPIIHDLMIRAFSEYKVLKASSTALDETVESVTRDMEGGEQAMLVYIDGEPAAMARFEMLEDALYFFRLSVAPEHQGKGIAKALLQALEEYAEEHGRHKMQCKVRMNIEKNMRLYEKLGYIQYYQDVYHLSGEDLDVAWMEKPIELGVAFVHQD